MFSKTFFNNLSLLLSLQRYFKVSLISFKSSTKLLCCESCPKSKRVVYLNFATICTWFICGMIHAAFLYAEKSLNLMNLILAFLFGAVIMIVVWTILVFSPFNTCRFINGHIIFFQYLQSKFESHLLFVKFTTYACVFYF